MGVLEAFILCREHLQAFPAVLRRLGEGRRITNDPAFRHYKPQRRLYPVRIEGEGLMGDEWVVHHVNVLLIIESDHVGAQEQPLAIDGAP